MVAEFVIFVLVLTGAAAWGLLFCWAAGWACEKLRLRRKSVVNQWVTSDMLDFLIYVFCASWFLLFVYLVGREA